MKSIWFILGYWFGYIRRESKNGFDAGLRRTHGGPTYNDMVLLVLPILQSTQTNRYVEAIKLLRGFTGSGLKEAKDQIDQIKSDHGIP